MESFGNGEITWHKMRSCNIAISTDGGLLHLSISHPTRYPKWDEIKAARMKYLPHSKTFAMLLPGEKNYVNLHPNCFHLYELSDDECGLIKLQQNSGQPG